jgi:GT2 family glycosyltransferase
MSKIDLSIIIVSWNTRGLLRKCLESIYEFTRNVSFEVIVVDNGSSDGSQGMVRRGFSEVKLIENGENVGFSKANNQGAKGSRGRYVLLLNSDTELKENALAKMVRFMDDNKEVGVLGAQLLREDGSVQPSGGNFPSLQTIACQQMLPLHIVPLLNRWLPVLRVAWGGYYRSSHEVDWVEGSCYMVRGEAWSKLEGLDENIFMYGEEVELCYRAKLAGWSTYYLAEAKIFHLEQGSSKTGRKGPVVGNYKGLKYFFQKHKPGWRVPISVLMLKLGAVVRMPLNREVYKAAFWAV